MLHWMIFLPLLGAFLLMITPKGFRDEVAGFITALTFAFGLWIWHKGGAGLQEMPWFLELGITYSVELSGVSLALALVTSFMSFIAVLYAARRIPQPGVILGLILAMETALLGIFAARDLILFYVFFEAALIPALMMLALYGGPRRMKAMLKFGAYTIFGGLLMLVSFIGYKYLGNSPTFALVDLVQHPVKGEAQTWLYLGFLAAMAVKLPIWPFHAWLPDFHEQNHESGIPDLMGTLYKVGGYGVFAFGITLFPDASLTLRPWLMGLAAFTALYAAWIAFQQTNWKRLMAYAGLSHMGFVALGVFSMHEIAVVGAMYLLAFQNFYTGALFLAVGMLQERIGSLDTQVGGVMNQAGALAGLTMSLWFASIAVPGFAGFIGEFSVLLGAYQVAPVITFVAGLTVIAAAAYALTAYQRTFWEGRPFGAVEVSDLQHTEWLILGLPLVVAIFFGVYSGPALALMQPTVKTILAALGGQ